MERNEGKPDAGTRPAETNDIKKIADELKGIRVAMITTMASDGTLHSRPMVPQEKTFDGELWFFTDIKSVKVDEIEKNPQVNISFVSPNDHRYISISGRADVRRDQKKIEELWSPAFKAWFPKGKSDPDLALLHVTPEVAQYWDTPSSTLVQVTGLIKAALTGRRTELGRSEVVRF